MEIEEDRISILLASVEREEYDETVSRPTGSFVRELFSEEVQRDTNIDHEGEDVSGKNAKRDQTIEDEEEPGEQGIVLPDQYDFDDLESTPLQTWFTENIITNLNRTEAYVSKDRKMLWYLQPSENTQVRTPRINVIRVRVGCVTRFAKNAITHIEAWNLFITDQIINDITVYTNICITVMKTKTSSPEKGMPKQQHQLKFERSLELFIWQV